eukprot:488327-Amphidinium_carterae.1
MKGLNETLVFDRAFDAMERSQNKSLRLHCSMRHCAGGAAKEYLQAPLRHCAGGERNTFALQRLARLLLYSVSVLNYEKKLRLGAAICLAPHAMELQPPIETSPNPPVLSRLWTSY